MTYTPFNSLARIGVERVRYAVDLVDKITGKRQTVVVQFIPLEIEEARNGPGGLDGPVARAFAYRLATLNMPEEFAVEDNRPLVRLAEDDRLSRFSH